MKKYNIKTLSAHDINSIKSILNSMPCSNECGSLEIEPLLIQKIEEYFLLNNDEKPERTYDCSQRILFSDSDECRDITVEDVDYSDEKMLDSYYKIVKDGMMVEDATSELYNAVIVEDVNINETWHEKKRKLKKKYKRN